VRFSRDFMRLLRWLKAHWIAVVAATALFVVGVGIGVSGSDPKAAESEPAAAEVRTEVETVSEAITETETVDPTEDQVQALEDRSAALDDRAAALKRREAAVASRERRVRQAERVAARSTFGDGTYLVGRDIPPGSYVARRAGGGCYWERTSRNGSNIILNHFGAGQARASVNRGELFSTQGCGTWRRG
jgi:hypothetical protein